MPNTCTETPTRMRVALSSPIPFYAAEKSLKQECRRQQRIREKPRVKAQAVVMTFSLSSSSRSSRCSGRRGVARCRGECSCHHRWQICALERGARAAIYWRSRARYLRPTCALLQIGALTLFHRCSSTSLQVCCSLTQIADQWSCSQRIKPVQEIAQFIFDNELDLSDFALAFLSVAGHDLLQVINAKEKNVVNFAYRRSMSRGTAMSMRKMGRPRRCNMAWLSM